MAATVRTVIYLAIIVGLLVILLPAEILERFGVAGGSSIGIIQFVAATFTLAGVGLALWCALTFAVLGRGTPLPFDPPRRLVRVGPYRWVRNPMAIGAGSSLVGVALLYESLPFFIFASLFMPAIHVMVELYEEPTLRRMFGAEYEAYCANVNRWLPHRPVSTPSGDGSA